MSTHRHVPALVSGWALLAVAGGCFIGALPALAAGGSGSAARPGPTHLPVVAAAPSSANPSATGKPAAPNASATPTPTPAASATGEPPTACRNVTATQTGPGQITITWDPPAQSGSGPVTSYDAGYGNGGNGNGEQLPPTARKATFTGLSNGNYQASVGAANAAGPGPRVFVPVTVGPWTPSSSPGSGSGTATGAGNSTALPSTGAAPVAPLLAMSFVALAGGSWLLVVAGHRREHAH